MTRLTLVHNTSGLAQIWQKRLSTWRSLWSDFNTHPASSTSPQAPEYDALQADMDALGNFCSAGEHLLMLTPAPDSSALLEKMDIWWETGGPHRSDRAETFSALRADVERLSKSIVT